MPKWQMIRASVEKQSLVVMIKAPPVWWSFVYNVNSRTSHPGMNQKREQDLKEDMRFFLARSCVGVFTQLDILLMWLLLLRGVSVRSDDPGPMESFVGSFAPHRAGIRMVQA